jgi:hypothetical protein
VRVAATWVFRLLGLLLVCGFIAHKMGTPDASLEIKVHAKLTPPQNLRIYHASGHTGFVEARAADLEPGGALVGEAPEFRIALNTPEPVTGLRIDTEKPSGSIEITGIEWITPQGSVRYTGKELLALQPILQHLEVQDSPAQNGPPSAPTAARLTMTGPDPFIQLQRPQDLQMESGWGHQRPWRWFRSPLLLLLGVALLVLTHGKTLRAWATGLHSLVSRCGHALGAPLSIRIGPGAVALLAAVPLVFALNVALKLHNSSVGMWGFEYGGAGHDVAFQWGEAQEIRSDEWFVHTPWLLNQVQTGFKAFNPNIGPPGAPLVAGVPVLHPTALAQPQFWGYFLLDVERGMSWHWGFRALSLLTSVFLLLLLLTQGQTLAALAGSLGVFGASFVQWWYSSWLTECITGLAGALIGVLVWSHSRNPKLVYPAAMVAAFSGMHVVLHPYLPFVVSLGFLGLFVATALLWEGHASGALRMHATHRALALLLGAAIFAALFGSYYTTARPAVEGIMNTVYPGKRTVLGGDLPIQDYLMGLFEFWRDKYQYPDPATNPSEAGRHLYLFPAVAVAALAMRKQVRFGPLFWGVLAYCLLAVAWMSVPLPDLFRRVLAAMGLAYIPVVRMFSGLGVACTLLLVLAVVRVSTQRPLSVGRTMSVLALCMLVVYWAWHTMVPVNPEFYTTARLLVSATTIAMLMWAVCRGQQAALLAGVLLAAFMPMQVNPFTSGLAPLLDKNLFQLTHALDSERKEKWIVFGGTPLSQLLRANGHEVVSGEYFVPRFDLMHHFDPSEEHVKGWNNYGALNFATSAHPERIDFVRLSPPYPDTVALHPCHPALTSVGVTRFVFHQRPDLDQMPCLQPLGAFEAINVFVYGVRKASP